jgi:hypothetical protein
VNESKRVDVLGVTTLVTGTLSSLVSRLVDRGEPISPDLKNADSATPIEWVKPQLQHPAETTIFLAAVWGGYFAGAASSVAVLFVSRFAVAVKYCRF